MTAAPTTSTHALRQRALNALRVTELYLEPREVDEHEHGAAYLSFLVDGQYDEYVDGRWHACVSGDVMVKPAGAPHRNIYHGSGCSVVVEILDESRWTAPALSAPRHLSDPGVSSLLCGVRRELAARDPSAPLVIEGLVVEILGRLGRVDGRREAVPDLRPAIEFIRDGRGWPSLEEVARAAGLPSHALVAAFRATVGCTVGDFIRRVRVEQAATRLATSKLPLSHVAVELGFSDQSHMTRLFKEHLAVTPGAYRRAVRSRVESFGSRSVDAGAPE